MWFLATQFSSPLHTWTGRASMVHVDDAQRRVVLLVEDQPSIRAVAAHVLKADGHHVLEAENGHSALMLVALKDLRIDLVVTDLHLPGLDGPALVTELARHHRRPPVLFISGGTLEPDDLPGPLLLKPFSMEALSNAVRRLLVEPTEPASPGHDA
jgi:two-component system cell cycle sensor histidine kinase/response regulator CckA